MTLHWTPDALEDLDEAGAYVAEYHPRAARRMAERVLEAVEGLVEFPNLGRTGRVRTTRELVVSGTPFLVIYRARLDELQVIRVLHHARRWPPQR